MEPVFAFLTAFHVIIANERFVFVWQYRMSTGSGGGSSLLTGLNSTSPGRERVVDTDREANASIRFDALQSFELEAPNDPITAITACENLLVVAKHSGTIICYRYFPCLPT